MTHILRVDPDTASLRGIDRVIFDSVSTLPLTPGTRGRIRRQPRGALENMLKAGITRDSIADKRNKNVYVPASQGNFDHTHGFLYDATRTSASVAANIWNHNSNRHDIKFIGINTATIDWLLEFLHRPL